MNRRCTAMTAKRRIIFRSGRSQTKFQDTEEIQENAMRQLLTVPQKGFPGMEMTLGKVCSFRRTRLQRRLNTVKLISVVVFFFIPPALILLDQTPCHHN